MLLKRNQEDNLDLWENYKTINFYQFRKHLVNSFYSSLLLLIEKIFTYNYGESMRILIKKWNFRTDDFSVKEILD